MPITWVDESPRSKYRRALSTETLAQAGGMVRERMQQKGAMDREVVSRYASALMERDKRDYEMASESWKNWANATSKQQEEFRQKTEAYTAFKKMMKRQGIEVFDDKGEIIFPPSKADADLAVKESLENLKESQRANRKPNAQEAVDAISKLNASRDTLTYMAQSMDKKSPEYASLQKELEINNRLIKFYNNFVEVETQKLGPAYAPQSAEDWLRAGGFGAEEE